MSPHVTADPQPATTRTAARRAVRRTASVLVSLSLSVGVLGLAAAPASAASKSLATRGEYNQIREGQSLSQVRNIIDSRGKSVGDGTYVWKSTAGKVVAVTFVGGEVADKQRLVVASLSEYNRIDIGDSYDRVKKIIGGPSQFSAQDDDVRLRLWYSPDLQRSIIITFDNGKVVDKQRG